MRAATVAALVLLALAAAVSDAARHGVIIYPVGDSATAGDAANAAKATGGRYAGHYSYRRYLYHMLTARGYEVRFAGSQTDCSVAGLDYDSHHDGYPNAKCDDIRNSVNQGAEAVKSSIRAAIKSLKANEADEITLIKVVSAGAEDIYHGRGSKDISEGSLRGLVDAVDHATNVDGINHRHTLIVPSAPPGGKREKDGAVWRLTRDFNRDSKYEDYRFFLTWRGQWYASKTAADCFSYFDFLRHYNKDGTQLNAYGDMSLARCIYDNIKVRKLLPKVDASTAQRRQCSEATASLLLRKPDSKAIATTEGKYFEPVVVNKALPPLTTIIVPAVLIEETIEAHPSCAAVAEGDGAAAKKSRLEAEDEDGGKKKAGRASTASNDACKGAPLFPPYEPFQSTTKDLWHGE